ncbi:hypothetical protein [Halobellus rufus]|uniref:hypothetical protein n=1 Tax=Halobellus rufus TaxID=1448860 RepID=UPI0006788A03|nr:hypothetical protein [Halobellus rufus]
MTALPKPDDSARPYHRILSMILHNTGDPQPVTLASAQLWTHVSNSSVAKSDARTALQAARENGHVIRHRDGEGQLRYGLTTDGVAKLPDAELPIYSTEDEGALQAVIGVEVSRPDDKRDQDVIGWANQHLQAVREVADE